MSRYIDVDAIHKKYDRYANHSPFGRNRGKMLAGFLDWIDEEPTADVVEVVHGEWIPTRKDSDISVCSNCESYWIIRDDAYDYLYCPKCGADMRGGEYDNE